MNNSENNTFQNDSDWIKDDPLGFDEMSPEEEAALAAQFGNSQSQPTPNLQTNEAGTGQTAQAQQQPQATNEPEVEEIEFDGDTSRANPHFKPLLPEPINRGQTGRQLIMDTETTGLDALKGDRVIEVGIIELVNRKFTG